MSVTSGPELGVNDPAIAHLLKKLYEVISFEEEHARITRITPEGTDYMDPSSFLAMTRSMLELGAYTSFYEFEVARHVQRFGHVAQVWSLYETRRDRGAARALGRGINSIQLIREGEAWRVLGLLWDEIHASPDVALSQYVQPGVD
jgi:hypothetical protein